jgi:hypothetical protein
MAGSNLSDSTNRDAATDYLAAVAEFGDPCMVAASGRLGRRLGRVVDRTILPPTAAAVAALAVVVADLTLLGIIAGHALTSPGSSMWAPVILAASASLTRVTLAGRAARRCLTIRVALT